MTPEHINVHIEIMKKGTCYATVGPLVQHGTPELSAANYVAVDGPLDQVWLPWIVRFAASGPL